MKLLMLLLILPLTAIAEGVHPRPPKGWVEINSLHPVILTWARAEMEKKLLDVPSFMVQKFPREKKFITFIQDGKPDSSRCRSISAEARSKWNQTWCLRENSVLVLLWKGEEALVQLPRQQLLSWILTHD